MNNNDGVLSTNQPNDGLLGNNNKGFFNNLSNINPNLIMGSQMVQKYDLTRKGLDWFRKTNAKAYMVLLD